MHRWDSPQKPRCKPGIIIRVESDRKLSCGPDSVTWFIARARAGDGNRNAEICRRDRYIQRWRSQSHFGMHARGMYAERELVNGKQLYRMRRHDKLRERANNRGANNATARSAAVAFYQVHEWVDYRRMQSSADGELTAAPIINRRNNCARDAVEKSATSIQSV